VNYFHPESRAVRVVDQLLDLLLVGILLGAPLIFYTRGHDVFEFNKLTVVRALSSLAGVLFLGKLLFVRPLALTRNALDLPVVAWLMVCLVATVHTVNWRLSVHGVYEDFEGITTWVNYVFLFYLAGQHVRSERQIRLVLGTVALAGTAMASTACCRTSASTSSPGIPTPIPRPACSRPWATPIFWRPIASCPCPSPSPSSWTCPSASAPTRPFARC